MEISWDIVNMKRSASDGFVTSVTWSIEATADGEQVIRNGRTDFNRPDEEINIVPFEDLTKDQVLNWVKEEVGDIRIERIVKRLEKELERRKELKNSTPKEETVTGTPWK